MSTKSLKDQFIEIFNTIDFDKIIDHPNILIAANFWDADRYCAARTCYKFMRTIDDMIDNHKASNRLISVDEREQFVASVNDWLKMISVDADCPPGQSDLIKTIEKFRIPLWPLQAFAKAMIYDINNDGFPTLNAFLEYSQGASVAPASVFVHLSGLTRRDGQYFDPMFDVKDAAIPCAIFSYIVHIIRDFQKDQFNNLNYFADEIITRHGLTKQELGEIARGRPVSTGFRNMIYEYCSLADKFRIKTRRVIDEISPLMEPRYHLSLEIIFDLYLMVFERINIEKSSFTTFELNPTPDETSKRVFKIITRFTR